MRVCQGEGESGSESENESEGESAVREKLREMERDRGREVLHSIYTNSRSTAQAALMFQLNNELMN